MTKRDSFLQAVGKDSVGDFLNFAQLHKNNADPFDLNELLQELSKKQKEHLWERLKTLLTDVLLEIPVENWQQNDEDSEDEMEVEGAVDLQQVMAVISGVTAVVAASVPVVDENVACSDLVEIALILNGIFPALPKSQGGLQVAIQRLFEAWWDKGLEGKEELGKNAFIMLLVNSLEAKCKAADIIHLWHFHGALLSFEFNSEESNPVKNLLLQCFMSTNHMKREEGRRFLSFLFSWNVEFIKMIHGTIKNQLQFLPKSMTVYVAEIYFRAWKKAFGVCLETIEHDCIQDLMHHGVHLPRKSPVQSKVRELLSYLHQQKLRQGVDEMLHRLYQPILWRGLKATNSEVRANAAILFVESFPLQDPGLNNEEADLEIQKQFEELFNLLDDPHPQVRSTGVLGVCKIAGKYWEMIPPSILTDLLTKVLCDLSADTSSAEVRCCVFKCLSITLNNKMSHPLLEQLLPRVRNSLHDNSEKVRVAFVDLLLKIKAVRAAKFWKICPMDHLLARLELDQRPTARRIVNLLFNSFFPVNQTEEVWCERCVTLIQMNPMAARKFYWYACEHTAPTNIAKLMLAIRRCLNACIQRAACDEDSDDEQSKENISVLDTVLTVADSSTMASLLEVIVILWRSINKALNENEEANNHTIRKFASVLPQYLKIFTDDCCTVPLVILASFMPASAVPTFSCGVLSKLRNMDKGAEEKKYSFLIDCLCQWGKVGHLLELITDWVSEGLPQKNKKIAQRTVRIQHIEEPKLELALCFLEYTLTHVKNRECLLAAPQQRLNQLLKSLGAIMEVLYSFLIPPNMCNINRDTALQAFSLQCRLAVHFHSKFIAEGRMYLEALEVSADWVQEKILPFLQDSEQHQSELAKQVLEVYLLLCKDIFMIGLSDSEFQAHLLGLVITVIHTEKGILCLPTILSILNKITVSCLVQNTDNTDDKTQDILNKVQKVFQKILEILARRTKKDQDQAVQILQSIQFSLGEFINTIQCWHGANEAVHREVLSTLLAVVMAELIHSLQKKSDLQDLAPPETVADLPSLSNCLMAVVLKFPGLIRSFLNELTECLDSETIQTVVQMVAALHILLILRSGKLKLAAIKDTAAVIHRSFQNYNEMEFSDIERALFKHSSKLLDNLLLP